MDVERQKIRGINCLLPCGSNSGTQAWQEAPVSNEPLERWEENQRATGDQKSKLTEGTGVVVWGRL